MGPFDAVELKRRTADAAGGAGPSADPASPVDAAAQADGQPASDGLSGDGSSLGASSADASSADASSPDGIARAATDGHAGDAPPARITHPEDRAAADEAAFEEVAGTVKWFDATKGYGFLIPDDGGADVLVHVTCLRRDGFPAAAEGARVRCQVVRRAKGRQAHRVLSLDLSTAVHPVAPVPRTRDVIVPGESFERATVKWFNRLRGFGFLTTGPGTPDIFVHMEILRRGGLGELRPGQVVYVRFGDSSKGRIAAEVKGDPASGDGASGDAD